MIWYRGLLGIHFYDGSEHRAIEFLHILLQLRWGQKPPGLRSDWPQRDHRAERLVSTRTGKEKYWKRLIHKPTAEKKIEKIFIVYNDTFMFWSIFGSFLDTRIGSWFITSRKSRLQILGVCGEGGRMGGNWCPSQRTQGHDLTGLFCHRHKFSCWSVLIYNRKSYRGTECRPFSSNSYRINILQQNDPICWAISIFST